MAQDNTNTVRIMTDSKGQPSHLIVLDPATTHLDTVQPTAVPADPQMLAALEQLLARCTCQFTVVRYINGYTQQELETMIRQGLEKLANGDHGPE